MKRNYLALLLALVMITGCIFMAVPAVYAEEADSSVEDTTIEDTTTEDTTTEDTTTEDTTTEDTTTEDTTTEDTSTEDTTEDTTDDAASAPQPKPLVKILLYIIRLYKKILAYFGL